MPARIVALPALTMAVELGLNDTRKPLQPLADAMAEALDPEIERWVAGYGGDVFDEEDATVPAVYPRFRRWTAVALAEIAAQKLGRANFKLYSVDKWEFDEDLGRIREQLAADFALVTLFRDTRRTTGHIVGNILIRRHFYFLQVGSACLVDLRDGRMVWCNAKADSWGNLSAPAMAKRAVGELLTDLYRPPKPDAPKGAPPVPKPAPAAQGGDQDEDPSP